MSSATSSPRPSPTIAAVTWSISRIPGPPAGPSLRITITSPGWMSCSATAREALLLGLEHPRRAGLPEALGARELDHAAVGREVAAQDREAALAASAGRVDRADDLLAGRLLGVALGLLADRAAGDRERVGVQDARVGEPLRDQRTPPAR